MPAVSKRFIERVLTMMLPKCKTFLLLLSSCLIGVTNAAPPSSPDYQPAAPKAQKKTAIDHSGKPRTGKASYYGKKFHGKKMADGTPMDPNSNIAASRTLPLGTKAEVTNLENGKSEIVEIRDRGPYVDGRIVDLTPKTAEKLDMKKDGVATVKVKPLEVPQPDGTVKRAAQAESFQSASN